MICAREGLAQSVDIDEDTGLIVLDIGLGDLQEIDKCFQEREILQKMDEEKGKTITELKKSLEIAEKELELERKENELNQRIIEIQKREIEAERRATEAMTQVADRALKLAETSKPKSNWLYAVGGVVAAFFIGLALGL
jgi:hypothetical protein